MQNTINNLQNSRLMRLVVLLAVIFSIDIFPKRMLEMNNIRKQKERPEYTDKQQFIAKEFGRTQIFNKGLDKKKGLLIFLDDSEVDKLGAVSYGLLIALYQEASPIIASTSLLHTLLGYSVKDNRSIDVLMHDFVRLDSKTTQKAIQEKKDILISKIGFKEDRWIIKKINNSLNLLIPVSYLDSLNIMRDKVKKIGNVTHVISDVELQLGLKVNHMETVDYKTLSRPIYARVWNYFFGGSPLADYFVDSLDNVFCKKDDYKSKNIDNPLWFIFLYGHGLINHSIADLSLNSFKKLLTFLENKVITKLLVIQSCYVAGVNTDIVYGEIKKGTQQYYSFPIIVQGLNDVITFSQMPELDCFIWNIKQKIQLRTSKDFADFLQRAKEGEGNYSEIIKPITEYPVESTPQIKLPGIEWFSVLDVDKIIVSIGSILAKTRDPDKPLDVISFFKKDPQIILLYTDNIPFELKIDSHNLWAIVSMVSSGLQQEDSVRTAYGMNKLPATKNFLKKADRWLMRKLKIMAAMVSSRLMARDSVRVIHRIKKVSSTKQSFFNIVHWFQSVANSNGLKWFFIEEIQDYKDILYKDILMLGTYNEGMRVYYKDGDNVLFTGTIRSVYLLNQREIFEKVTAASEHEKFYQERMRIIQEEYPQLSAEAKKSKQEITPEQVKKIENVLFKQLEKQKALAVKNYPLVR